MLVGTYRRLAAIAFGIWMAMGSGLSAAQPVTQFDADDVRSMSTSVSHDEADVDKGPSMRGSMQFKDVPLLDVLKIFSQQTGINLVASQDVSNEQAVTLYFEDVEVLDALDQLLDAANLYYER